jgi:hypothetical protein
MHYGGMNEELQKRLPAGKKDRLEVGLGDVSHARRRRIETGVASA